MQSLLLLLWCLSLRLTRGAHARVMRTVSSDDRGDVPGWVLITVMSAGLVAGLWAVAGDKLNEMLTTALDSVTG